MPATAEVVPLKVTWDGFGSETPRHFTPPLRVLTPETSKGFEVIDFAQAFLGIELLPWQKWLLTHALELNEDGTYRFRTVVVIVGRQNGKTTILMVLALWRIVMGEPKSLVLGTSTSLDYAKEAWEGAVALAEESEDIEPLIAPRGGIRRANGEQQLQLVNKSRYKIAAATRRGGRSLSVDLGIADELREHHNWEAWSALSGTTTAKPDSQIWALSNAGDDSSVVLNHQRDSGLATIETGEGDETLALFEWSAPEGCELDDPLALAQANPALGHTIKVTTLQGKMATMPPNAFRTEHLCQRVAALNNAIDAQAWEDCLDQDTTLDAIKDRAVLSIEVALDLKHVTLMAAAVTDTGKVKVDVVDAWDSVQEAREALPGWLKKIRPRRIGWFPNGPSAALAADMEKIKASYEMKNITTVCQSLAEQVLARQLIHPGDPLLSAQVAGSVKVDTGDGWRFGRKNVNHVDAVYALAGAVHLARTMPRPLGKPRILTAK